MSQLKDIHNGPTADLEPYIRTHYLVAFSHTGGFMPVNMTRVHATVRRGMEWAVTDITLEKAIREQMEFSSRAELVITSVNQLPAGYFHGGDFFEIDLDKYLPPIRKVEGHADTEKPAEI